MQSVIGAEVMVRGTRGWGRLQTMLAVPAAAEAPGTRPDQSSPRKTASALIWPWTAVIMSTFIPAILATTKFGTSRMAT